MHLFKMNPIAGLLELHHFSIDPPHLNLWVCVHVSVHLFRACVRSLCKYHGNRLVSSEVLLWWAWSKCWSKLVFDEARPRNRNDAAFLLGSFGCPLGPASVRCSTLHQTQAAGIKSFLSAEQAAVIYDFYFVEYVNDGFKIRGWEGNGCSLFTQMAVETCESAEKK